MVPARCPAPACPLKDAIRHDYRIIGAAQRHLINELPHAPGLLAQAPDDLRERLAAAFGMQAVYRQDTRQATIVLTITDTAPGIIDAILADPRIDHDTDGPPASHDTSVDVTDSPIVHQINHITRIHHAISDMTYHWTLWHRELHVVTRALPLM